MSTDDESARHARAKRLRAEIDSVIGSTTIEGVSATDHPTTPAVPESPRDFVQRRMREVEQQDKPNA